MDVIFGLLTLHYHKVVQYYLLSLFFHSDISVKCPNLNEIFRSFQNFDHFYHCQRDFSSKIQNLANLFSQFGRIDINFRSFTKILNQ